MEFTLLLSGIRNSSVFDLFFNSIFEFNIGAPIPYLMLFALVPKIEKKRKHVEQQVETELQFQS
jgi:hypothetical protein